MLTKAKKPVRKRFKASQKVNPVDKPGDINTQTDSAVSQPGDSGSGDFPVVGIGASAGGLAAFEAFFSGMPADVYPGMAFVLVQHLAPDHKSILTELVQKYTRMQVFEVEDGIRVRPNCAYIIPPNRDLAFLNGSLQLLEQNYPRGQRLPIDFFFRTLAQDQHEKAICIVLSGTGSDGTQGVRAIKGEGGMVIAQNPESTEYDGMPRNAIATGMVDYILPPAEMPSQLIAYVNHTFMASSSDASTTDVKTEDALKKTIILLRTRTGHDFSLYKEKTISRRVERRMALHQIVQADRYVRYLQQNPAEIEALFRDLLIGVTSFFRDPEAFSALAEQIIPDIVKNKPADALLRVWVNGCSTGEEAYSIAMLLQEYMEAQNCSIKIQVFATDIDSRAIETARAGTYPSGITADVSAERLTQFFTHDEASGAFRIKKRIRDMIVFSEQDLIRDPPFSKLDMICCRNLLIYLGSELQKKLIPLFHYALNPGGILFLGSSETVGNFVDLFKVLDRKSKVYKRTEDVFKKAHGRNPGNATSGAAYPRRSLQVPVQRKITLREIMEKNLLQHFSPVGALVNEFGDILYLQGRTGLYLEPSQGESSQNILRMAREGLRQDLSAALRRSDTRNMPVFHKNVRVKTNGEFTLVNITVRPVASGAAVAAQTKLYLVVLEDTPALIEEPPPGVRSGKKTKKSGIAVPENDKRIASLRQELRIKEDYLQTTIEELNSSNEEMQSVNEELQSTNEELETSKEELQSVNEELSTINAELQAKVADLTLANSDMNNLLAGTGIGTIFVDNQMRIRRFTPVVTKVINLIPSDVGRPVNDIASNLVGYDRLMEYIQTVLDSLVPREDKVQTRAGGWYLLRIHPYRTSENGIEGVVITFTDITKQRIDEPENDEKQQAR